MRTEFHDRLESMTCDLGEMCDLAGQAIQHATRALLAVDLAAAESVVTDVNSIRQWNTRAEREAVVLLARQAPVARDLRAVVASLHIAADIDRMGGLAAHVARTARRRHPSPALPDEMKDRFAEMGRTAVELASGASSIIESGDPVQATTIRSRDEAMNSLNRELFRAVTGSAWSHGVEPAVDVILLGRFYERFADHAVEIARRVIFRTDGAHPQWSASA
jgi:phosphate transport system protein